MDVNGLGVLMGTQEAAKQMIAQGNGGKIINTASIGPSKATLSLRTIARASLRSRR
jgi:NAD(P)-dependent dehydrogenase (short-subunit alcohol dehydrogenase family)